MDSTWLANGEVFDYAAERIRTEHLEGRIGIHLNQREARNKGNTQIHTIQEMIWS